MSTPTPDLISSDEAFFDFKCPYCNETASFPQSGVGQASECPHCTGTFFVPEVGSDFGRRLPVPIVTSRLTLRRLETADCGDLAEFMSDAELFALTGGRPMDEEEISQWLVSDSKVSFTTPDQLFYLTIVPNDTRRVMGWVSLNIDQPSRAQATLNMVIDRKRQRSGLGTEALRAMLNFCLADVRLHRVVAYCDGRNAAAQRVFEKVGMRYEAQFLEDRPDGDGWADTLWFGLLQREWPPAGKELSPGIRGQGPA